MQHHPFFEFINFIGAHHDALDEFVDDPDGDARAADLTAEQKAALLGGTWDEIERLVRIEFPGLAAQELQTNIGWNMRAVLTRIQARQRQNDVSS